MRIPVAIILILSLAQSCDKRSIELKELLRDCDQVIIEDECNNLYNISDAAGIKVFAELISGDNEDIANNCKPSKLLHFKSKGQVILSAEFSTQLPKCNYVTYSYKSHNYKHRLTYRAGMFVDQVLGTNNQEISSPIARHVIIDPIKTMNDYALNYIPSAIDLPKLSDTVKLAIDSLLQTDTTKLKIWTALILIKQFSYHLECCNQGYEIRNLSGKPQLDKESNPILFAFLKLTNQLELGNCKNEFLNSGFIHSYLLEHPELANNKLIKPYFARVDKKEKGAEEQIRLNDAKKKNGS